MLYELPERDEMKGERQRETDRQRQTETVRQADRQNGVRTLLSVCGEAVMGKYIHLVYCRNCTTVNRLTVLSRRDLFRHPYTFNPYLRQLWSQPPWSVNSHVGLMEGHRGGN